MRGSASVTRGRRPRRCPPAPRGPATRAAHPRSAAPAPDATARVRRACGTPRRRASPTGRAAPPAHPTRAAARRRRRGARGRRRPDPSVPPSSGRRRRGRRSRARAARSRAPRARRSAADPPRDTSCACSMLPRPTPGSRCRFSNGSASNVSSAWVTARSPIAWIVGTRPCRYASRARETSSGELVGREAVRLVAGQPRDTDRRTTRCAC